MCLRLGERENSQITNLGSIFEQALLWNHRDFMIVSVTFSAYSFRPQFRTKLMSKSATTTATTRTKSVKRVCLKL